MTESEPNSQSMQEAQRLAPGFIEQVKQVLEHLYDFPFLQSHPLALSLASSESGSASPSGHSLRQSVLRAIDALNPGAGIPFRSPHARLYHLLHMHYVEGMTLYEVERELGVSRRQIYRDLRKAEESVAALLWESHASQLRASVLQQNERDLSSLPSEVEHLEPNPGPIDLCMLLARAHSAVENLAAQRNVQIQMPLPAEPVIIWSELAIAQQVLISILSHAVQNACAGDLALCMAADNGQVHLTLTYRIEENTPAHELSLVVRQLAKRLRWTLAQQIHGVGERCLHVHMPHCGPVVLVIDDNAGLVELLRHYLASHACQVVAARRGQEGLSLAESLLPDAILLDIMLPEMDGWEVLQTLRNRPQTAKIPVVVCSVFNDPQLAFSLGASHFLSKPITRNNILLALRELNVARGPFSSLPRA